jgi:hypothetical protein
VKYPITHFKSLEDALKALEPFVRNGQHLLTGRPLGKMGLHSRELLANWLICAVINRANGRSFLFSSDPVGGDGLIVDRQTADGYRTEHVMVPTPRNREPAHAMTLILRAIKRKNDRGERYASGKTLVVFLNADLGDKGVWFPNEVARELPDPLHFSTVWVVAFEAVEDGEYIYNVVDLDASNGDAPIFRVSLAKDFASWMVTQIR